MQLSPATVANPAGATRACFDAAQKATVLLVDDTPENLDILKGCLKAEYTVRIATSGQLALRIAAGDPQPDLILLDIMMPEMDGHEVIRRLQADPRTRNIPVIFVTARSEDADEALGLELGAVDYIAKPFSVPVVRARVRNHINLSHRTKVLRSLSDKLSHYLPPQVYKTIFDGDQKVAIEAKSKTMTIFFSDIKDFTQTTEDLHPHDLTNLLNKYFSEMSRIAMSYGATIDKFVGDAMLIFFGDPQTLGVKNDAVQCARMAWAMQQRMAELQHLWHKKGYHRPFRMRIGINTGVCNVGNFGSEERMDYTVIGAEVNLAARLEQLGEPGDVTISHETYLLVRDEFDVAELPPIKAKGIAQDIRRFVLTGQHTETNSTNLMDSPT
jgi:class 3 adenylate cyclase/FixJ family two-component response regulator